MRKYFTLLYEILLKRRSITGGCLIYIFFILNSLPSSPPQYLYPPPRNPLSLPLALVSSCGFILIPGTRSRAWLWLSHRWVGDWLSLATLEITHKHHWYTDTHTNSEPGAKKTCLLFFFLNIFTYSNLSTECQTTLNI